jgi:hypothetical protein
MKIIFIFITVLITGCQTINNNRAEKLKEWIENATIDCEQRDGYLIIEYSTDEPRPWLCVPKKLIGEFNG